jgi:BMFP domain-containing protein YqiC
MTLDPMQIVTAVLAVLVLAAVAVTAWQFAVAAELRRTLAQSEARLDALRRDVEAATAVAVRAGERLRKAETTVTQLADRLGQLELRGEGRPYDQAIALVRHGADAERLVRNFGLTRGEADLVTLVHGRRKAG